MATKSNVQFDNQGQVIGLGSANVRGQKVRVIPVDDRYRIEVQNRYNNDYMFLDYGEDFDDIKKIISGANNC